MKSIIEKDTNNVVMSYNGFPEKMIDFFGITSLKNDFVVLIHGNFGYFQDVECLINLITLSKNYQIKYRIIGYGAKFPYIKEKLSNFEYVEIYDVLTEDNLYEHFKDCSIGLSIRKQSFLTSLSFPVRVWEYIGACIPIISSPIETEASHLITSLKIGLAANANPIDILDKIIHLKKDPFQIFDMKRRLIKIRPDFTREKQLAKINFVFNI
jgi:hypothetical protein